MDLEAKRSGRSRRAAIALAAAAGSVAGGWLSAGAGGAGPTVVAAADGPPAVAGLGKVLDAFSTGAAAGPGVVNGIVVTVVGSQSLPPPADQVQSAILQGFTEIGAQIKENGQAGVEAMRQGLAPIACANPAINAGIEGLASAFDSFAALGAPVAPFDLTAAETAVLLRTLQAPEAAC